MKNKNILKTSIKVTLFLLVVIGTYFAAWWQLYDTSKEYYKSAMQFYQNDDFMSALKGKRTITETDSGYMFKAGFEQVVNIFKSKYAYPKPKIYYDAKEKVEEVIYKKMSPDVGLEIYNKYFKLDNIYLGEILLQVGNIYEKEGNITKAINTYELAKESFPLNEKIYRNAVLNINKLQQNENSKNV
jgi:tetratricopeptide (TPR) repeat protein